MIKDVLAIFSNLKLNLQFERDKISIFSLKGELFMNKKTILKKRQLEIGIF